ncbi:hypothetical protein JZO70_00505 [Enterococcus sp. 669A]|uniref:Integral membrane protein n=1 Tax=Candidatus Enterococcus moelleringii TaxID=2815325 RepID=A0ABS3L843_9ENTE|nr:hypothetical protein [Enterococcus sp. 669A]MBO1304624.1 hypothetical protein [Enterococcus sp. 669A]
MRKKWCLLLKSILEDHPLLGLVVVSLFLLVPQMISRNMIVGSDSIFHFNRFYDTAMQLEEGNFQYFSSMYGFQQSGRIVNALYSPYLAYLQGGLLLIAKTWFNYQLLSNFLLYILSGCSMYLLLKKLKVKTKIAFAMAVIYLSTFAVQYWITRQGFSSWGAALLPICLTPIISMTEKNDVKLDLGFYTALMFQTHFLSALFLVMIYLPFYLRAFVRSAQKVQFVLKTGLAIGCFALLTLNIWHALFQVYSGNEILAPFINQSMAESTLTYSSFYCLFTPFFLFIIIVKVLIVACKVKNLSPFLKMTIWTSVFFLILGSNLIPWTFLLERKIKIVQLIQFPFRFVIPATVLILVALALLLNDYHFDKLKIFKLKPMVVLAITQTVILQIVLLGNWAKSDEYIFSLINTTIADVPAHQVKDAFYSHDLNLALHYIQKSTPDYLPVHSEFDGSRYKLYQKQIIAKELSFEKSVEGDCLVVTWDGGKREKIQVPVFGYEDTVLRLNGNVLDKKDVGYSEIGVVTIPQKLDNNRLELRYLPPKFFNWSLGISLLSCAFSLVIVVLGRIKDAISQNVGDLTGHVYPLKR